MRRIYSLRELRYGALVRRVHAAHRRRPRRLAMSTELFAGKKPRRASSPLRAPFRADSAELRRQAANMLHAFAERRYFLP